MARRHAHCRACSIPSAAALKATGLSRRTGSRSRRDRRRSTARVAPTPEPQRSQPNRRRRFGAALSFDGNDRVDVADSASLDLSTATPLEAGGNRTRSALPPSCSSSARSRLASTLHGADEVAARCGDQRRAATRDVREHVAGADRRVDAPGDAVPLGAMLAPLRRRVQAELALSRLICISSGALRIGGQHHLGRVLRRADRRGPRSDRCVIERPDRHHMGRSGVPSDTTRCPRRARSGSTATGVRRAPTSSAPPRATTSEPLATAFSLRPGQPLATVTGTSKV